MTLNGTEIWETQKILIPKNIKLITNMINHTYKNWIIINLTYFKIIIKGSKIPQCITGRMFRELLEN